MSNAALGAMVMRMRAEPVGYRRPPTPVTTGYVPQDLIFTKMNMVDAVAKELDRLIPNIKRQAFRDSWSAWYGNWRKFYDSYQGILNAPRRAGTIFFSDRLNEMVDSWVSQVKTYRRGYDSEESSSGASLPKPSTPEPDDPLPESPDMPGAIDYMIGKIPWWIWVTAIGGVAVAGYVAYKTMKNVQHTQDQILPMLPTLLAPEATVASKALSKSGHDPLRLPRPPVAGDCGCMAARDPGPLERASLQVPLLTKE